MNQFEQFKKIDLTQFIAENFMATEHLFLSMPSIDTELADVLVLAKQQNPDIKIYVVIDNSEESIRNGFGDIDGIDKLLENGIQIFQSDDNLISFVITDIVGYFLFPHSRIFIEKSRGTNAFKIDPVSIKLLKQYFFATLFDKDKLEDNVILEDASNHFKEILEGFNNKLPLSNVIRFDDQKHESNKQKLKINPPNPPDLQRQINTYSAKIQFVELKFSGGNIQNKIIQLPPKAIPINSDELKSLLQTRIKIFQNFDENNEYQKFIKLKENVDDLRKRYLTPIKCRPGKRIIKIEQKEEFFKELNKLKKETETLNSSLLTILEEGRLNTLDLLKKELKEFLIKNEPDELKSISNTEIKERRIEEISNKIVASVKFPQVDKLIMNINLTEFFYDLTWYDFKDENLLKEFREKEIMTNDDIDQIVRMKKVYETRH